MKLPEYSEFEIPRLADDGDVPTCLSPEEIYIFPPAEKEGKENKILLHIKAEGLNKTSKIVRGCLSGIFECDLQDDLIQQAYIGKSLFKELQEFGIDVTDFSYFITETPNCIDAHPFIGAVSRWEYGMNLKRNSDFSDNYISNIDLLFTQLCSYVEYKLQAGERCLLDIYKPEQFIYYNGNIILVDVDPLFFKDFYKIPDSLSFSPMDYILGRLRKSILVLESNISRNRGAPVKLFNSRQALLNLMNNVVDTSLVSENVLNKIRYKF